MFVRVVVVEIDPSTPRPQFSRHETWNAKALLPSGPLPTTRLSMPYLSVFSGGSQLPLQVEWISRRGLGPMSVCGEKGDCASRGLYLVAGRYK